MNRKKILTMFFVVGIVGMLVAGSFFVFGAAPVAHAQALQSNDLGISQVGQGTGLPATDVRIAIAKIVRAAFGFLGTVAFLLFLYGGFVWMTAGGNDEKIVEAKKIMTNTAIGLAIILSAFGLTQYVITQLLAAVNGGAEGSVSSNSFGCTGPDCIGGGGGSTGNVFYISSLPASGNACVQNVHPAIVFNRDVDIATVQDAVVIQKKSDVSAVPGVWQYGAKKTVAIFVPQGTCGSSSSTGCFEQSTNYQVQFKNPSAIKSLDNLSLNCSLRAGCKSVDFTSGTGIETSAPRISVSSPAANASFPAGEVVPFTINYVSDNGLQNISLYQNGSVISGQSIIGCSPTGTVSLSWPTAGLPAGSYTIESLATGWSGLQGSVQTPVTVAPLHCFNSLLETDLGEIVKGPPACGGECGSCGGASCKDSTQCASGYCDVTSAGGVCVDRMRIDDFSPRSGAPGTYVSIVGSYFGSSAGAVYFAKVANPNPANLSDWVKANLVACVAGINSWGTNQLLVEVPAGIVSGPILVITSPQTQAGTSRTFSDSTSDSWGARLGDFQVTSQVRPGLCALKPDEGMAGDTVQLLGKNFGLFDSASDLVSFDGNNATVLPTNWSDSVIKSTVPTLVSGVAAVKVTSNGVESNAVRFVVNGGESLTNPLISNSTPSVGAGGEYITITGKNFGSKVGAVWFKTSEQSEAILGDFVFPESCKGAVWRDDQVIVKFPQNKGVVNALYRIQIKTADNKLSAFDSAPSFTLKSGLPSPGICKISPLSGTSPFPVSQTLTISGEYFGTNSQVFFWKSGANSSSVDGRVVVDQTGIVAASDTSLELKPPAGISTGPVVLLRSVDKKLSNPEQFQVVDCVKNNNTCPVAGSVCCATGPEAGLCKAAGELCEGALRSTAYIWRFSTNDIPKIPQVVERCDQNVDDGLGLPTPSPSTQWSTAGTADDQVNVCRTALITVEFNTAIDQATINGGSVKLFKCSSVSSTVCNSPTAVGLLPESFVLKTAAADVGGTPRNFVSLVPSAGRFDDGMWYQVVLGKSISSAAVEGKTVPLQVDRPCSKDSAYCFVFKTGAQDCKMKAVIITPYSYWTTVLESPIKYRAGGAEKNLEYVGNGLSSQHCIMMNVDDFSWSWGSGNKDYASIFGPDSVRNVQATAQANTVGVGLTKPDDAVTINATARQGALTFSAKSPLTIDLNTPGVLDYWPRCQEACSIAEVGIKFNTTMSQRNIPGAAVGGAVQLLKCLDENCLSTVPVLVTTDVFLDQESDYTVLKVANSRLSSVPLEIGTVYQVIVSSSSTDPLSSLRQVWSAAKLHDPSTYSRPFNQQFTWRFKTKRDSCRIDRVEVSPEKYVAKSITERAVFSVQPYSSPDNCSQKGQKINPWSVGWTWAISDDKVASLHTFTTKGTSPACTAACVRRGSELPASAVLSPMCGNGLVEAGEDCDMPDKANGCGLDCRFMGNTGTTCGNGVVEPDKGEACDPKDTKTQIGCSTDCRHTGAARAVSALSVNASICGSGTVGSGKDCDSAIPGSIKDPRSSLLCSEQCLHVGTEISSKWCSDNRLTKGGFAAAEFDTACAKSLSQCGNNIQEPEEDALCDTVTGWNSQLCNEFCLKKTDTQCTPGSEGCDGNGRLLGSSLAYKIPSVCGDGVVGTGELAFCENTLLLSGRQGLIDPWSLVIGKGLGVPKGEPPAQTTVVSASTNQNTAAGTVKNSGEFSVACGFATDDECRATFGADYGVGSNSCCTVRPKLVSTYPLDKTPNACPNTYLDAVFDSVVDADTLGGGVIIARGATNCSSTADDVTSLVAYAPVPVSGQTFLTRISASIISWWRSLLGTDAQAVSPRWCIAPDIGNAEVLLAPEISATASRLRVNLKAPLQKDAEYAIIVKNTVKTKQGVAVTAQKGGTVSWSFTTAAQMCELKTVTVAPATWSFTKIGASTTLYARAATANGTLIQGIPGLYDWYYSWSPAGNSSVQIESATSSVNKISALNRNGEVLVRAAATLSSNSVTSATGTVAAGQSRIIVLLCENPWPPKDLYLGTNGPITIFPFEDALGNNDGFDLASNTFNNTPIAPSPTTLDGYFNFSTYYCADKGLPGTTDDLPYLRGTVQVSPVVVSATTSLKRFLFTNSKNNDVIGLQVFPNPKHLTVTQWYTLDKAQGGQGFAGSLQDITVDGFGAVSDGNNVYIDALNYSSSSKALFSNIYLLSINANASPDTRTVFEQLLKNFKLAINLTNYGYCAKAGGAPDFTAACRVDFDCQEGYVCSATVDKLRRNYDRLRGLESLQNALTSYANSNNGLYPSFEQGSYLKGQALSTWPAWNELESIVGRSVPRDPVNVLGKGGTCSVTMNRFCTANAECPVAETCVMHDPETLWSTADRRFSFACATSSLAYRYMSISSTQFMVRANLEDPGVPVSNMTSLIKDFIDPAKFVVTSQSGICNQDQEISTLNQGRCGDGVVNFARGEECDPPTKTRYGACSAEQVNKVRVDVCSSACKYVASSTPFIACSALSACGNGKVEAGEMCDEGVLNGTYNHCSKTCSWPPANPPGYCGDGQLQTGFEICDYKMGLRGKNGLCVSGVETGNPCNVDEDCRAGAPHPSVAGRCQLFSAATGRYGTTAAEACALDCHSPGPRCGDGIVQAEFGEECDGAQQCTVDGVPGTKNCSATCRLQDSSPDAWFRFNDIMLGDYLGSTFGMTAEAKSGVKEGLLCDKTILRTDCPEYVAQGKVGGALNFDGKNQGLVMLATVPGLEKVIENTNKTAGASAEAWIKPTARGEWPRIVEKGGYLGKGGFTLQLDDAGEHASFVVWNKDSDITKAFSVIGKTVVPLNVWSHITGVFERRGNYHVIKIYVNGVLDGVNEVTSAEELYASTQGDGYMFLGRGASVTSYFTGSIDEVKVYGRTLSASEITNRASDVWACSIAPALVVAGVPSASCGDGKVDAGEACDRGTQNGQACTPDYNKTCTYCASDCRNVIDVQPKQFCGNSVIEGPEICEADAGSKLIYTAGQDSSTKSTLDPAHNGYEVLSCADEPAQPYTVKKGTKSCIATCSAVQSSCIVCGVDTDRGAVVQGGIINVLEPLSTNPLLGASGVDSKIDLTLSSVHDQNVVGRNYWSQNSASSYSLRSPAEDAYTSNNQVKLGSDTRCSFGDGPTYKMFINEDDSHPINFPIVSKPAPSQYDLILSPVISKSKRPHDIRIVTRWVGNTVDFVTGFMHGVLADGTPEPREQFSFPTSSIASRQDYWNAPSLEGIWYHGFGSTNGGTNEVTYTLTSDDLRAGRYVFYVRLPQANPADPGISRYIASSRLQVDVYFPENDASARFFARPALTFYSNQAQISDNQSAPYWQVFDVKTDPAITDPASRIVPIQKITTKAYIPAL